MKIIRILVISIVIVILLVSCNVKFNISNDTEQNELIAIKVDGDYISPQTGSTLSDARKLIVEYLIKNGIKGDVNTAVKVKEITTKDVWKNTAVQLYMVDVDYAWVNGVAIIKDNEVLVVLNGMPTLGVFLTDLDKDNIYEIYTNKAIGSGIISYEIEGYNIVTKELYHLEDRMNKDYMLNVKDNVLMVDVLDYNDEKVKKTGKLMLRDNDKKNKLKEIYVK